MKRVYPVTKLTPLLEKQVAPYRAATGDALHFPFKNDIPFDLITTVATFLAKCKKA